MPHEQASAPAGGAAPLDEQFDRLTRSWFDSVMERSPVWATYIGLHEHDTRLAASGRDAIEGSIEEDRAFLRHYEALDAAALSPENRFERELAINTLRRNIFSWDVARVWERRGTAMDEIGDGLFLLLARDFAPLAERLASATARLEDAPRVLHENQERLGDSPVALWSELELRSAAAIGSLFTELAAAARTVWSEDSADIRRLDRAISGANAAVETYRDWLRKVVGSADGTFALGRERYDELVGLRAFDGLTSDDILAIGEEQLAENRRLRADVARRIDPHADEADVVDRVKTNHPETFEAALEEYRASMFRARQHLIDRDLVTIPPSDRLDVVATPEYLRSVLPFAAYFEPPRFDAEPSGIYVVTPSVDGDPRAMREHSYASISNTSIHEAYPGHHLQLSAAMSHPSLVRALVDAPEFVEGWGMYSEQLMREEGFDDAPEFLVSMYTDAIWRACRIVLDVRLHRGEIDVDDAIAFLVDNTGFERPNATAEVHRYTYTPTYQLSYLLGKVMLLRLRDDERRRLGRRFSLKAFHDSLVYAGSLPISFHRRLLAGEGDGAASAPGTGRLTRAAAR